MTAKKNKIESTVDAYLQDENLTRIANFAASTFTKTLSRDEIKTCILTALWRAANKYDRRKRAKLTTYLYNGVVFECLNQKRFNASRRAFSLENEVTCKHKVFEGVDMIDAINKKCDDPELVIDRFYEGMTIAELAKKHNTCNETIRVRLKKNLEKLKDLLVKSV